MWFFLHGALDDSMYLPDYVNWDIVVLNNCVNFPGERLYGVLFFRKISSQMGTVHGCNWQKASM